MIAVLSTALLGSILPQTPQPAPIAIHWQQERDGDWRARGPDYRFRCAADGEVEFHALADGAQALPTLRFQLTAVSRAGGPSVPLDIVSHTRTGDTVALARAGVIERYEACAAGVEQSFELAALPPGGGDLVVSGRIATSLAPSIAGEQASTLLFGGGDRIGFRVGEVTGIDAHGNRCAGTMRCADGRLELILPAAFVERAALPLVVDPLIGTELVPVTSAASRPDAAFDPATRTWAIVWKQDFGNGAWQPYYRLLGADGTFRTAPLPLRATTPAPSFTGDHRVRVANLAARSLFVAAWDADDNGASGIFAGVIDARTTAATQPQAIVPSFFLYRHTGPDLSSEVTDPSSLLMAWHLVNSGDNVAVARVVVQPDRTLVPLLTYPVVSGPIGPRLGWPAIAGSGGPAGRALVVWTSQDLQASQ